MSDEEIEAGWDAGYEPSYPDEAFLRKRPFMKMESNIGDKSRMLTEVMKRTGIPYERLVELERAKCRLTQREFEVFRRCPAHMLPESEILARRQHVQMLLEKTAPTERDPPMAFPEKFGRQGTADRDLDKMLKKPAKIMTSFIRIRPKRLLGAMSRRGLLEGQVLEVAKNLYRPNITTNRYCATLMLFAAISEDGKKELKLLLDGGGYWMDNAQWIKVTKAHHELVKVSRVCLSKPGQMEPDDIVDLLYFNQCTGRDHFMDNEATEEEVKTRSKVPKDYTWPDGNRDRLEEYAKNRWHGLMADTGAIRACRSWKEFLEGLYFKLPGGSCPKPKVDMKEIGGIRGLVDVVNKEIRGNKRFAAELKPIRHFKEFEGWEVTAFLKYEVAKNRWLYPGSLEWIILGMFMLDSVIDAFYASSGCDLGHTLESSVGTKLSVVRMVISLAMCFNTDGKGFNENQSNEDMCLTYDVLTEATRFPPGADESITDLREATEKYKESLNGRRAKIPKLWKDANVHTVEVDHTLFSGEFTTQVVNTFWIGTAAMSGAGYLEELGAFEWLKAFFKGDDLNGFTSTWIHAWLLLTVMEEAGFIFEPAKDHIEPGMCEHERCIVTSNGYRGTKARRIGAMVAAEPQGAEGLTWSEAVDSANEARMSLLSRGVSDELAIAFFEANITTYFDLDVMPRKFYEACGIPKINGGLGLWHGGKQYYNTSAGLQDVTTEFKLKPNGPMSTFGNAHMTDPMLKKLAEDNNVEVSKFMEVRAGLIGDSFISTLGPKAKYGNRRRESAQRALKMIDQMKYKHMEFAFSPEVRSVAEGLITKLKERFKDPEGVSGMKFVIPADVIANTISRSGCINEQVFKIVKDVSTFRGVVAVATATQKPPEEQELVDALKYLPESEKMVFYEDELRVVFHRRDERVNKEVAAYVRRAAINAVALSCASLKITNTRKQVAAVVKWELITTEVAQRVWAEVSETLRKISF